MARAINAEDAVLIGLSDEQRKQECYALVSKTLARYGCILEPVVIITTRGTELRVDVRVVPMPLKTDNKPGG